jgi:tRNA threonylcarbamoyladenosine biosynthesis protein TsaB
VEFWTLGIETATAVGSVALLRDEATAAELKFEAGSVHGRDLVPSIRRLLDRHRLTPRRLGLSAVDLGPGSYTGVRVGLAAAHGLALAVGCPLVGVESLAAMIAQEPEPVVPVIDARRARVFARVNGENLSLTPEALLARLPPTATLALDGAGPAARALSARRLLTDRPPRAETIARLGLARFRAEGAADPRRLRPVYLTPAP